MRQALLFLIAVASASQIVGLQRHPRLNRNGGKFAAATASPIPVGGNVWPVAVFWAFLEVGTPPVSFPVAIDSGSDTLDIPLLGCKGCVSQAPNTAFMPANSSTAVPLECPCKIGSCVAGKCRFSNTYETCDPKSPTNPCTISGVWYEDAVSWGGAGPVTVAFGAIDYQTSNFEQFYNIDGVVGMAGSNSITSVFSQLVAAKAVDANSWGLCLHQGNTSNGTLTLGSPDARLYHGDIAFTPSVSNAYYEMGMTGLLVNGKPVGAIEPTIILDSGTNILLLPNEAFASMKKVFLAECKTTPLKGMCNVSPLQTFFDGVCFNMSVADVAAYPPLTLELAGGVNLTMTAKDYILQGYGPNPVEYCLGVEKTSAGGLQIMGDTTLQNYYTLFDRANKQIGFAPVNTDTCGSL